MPASLRVRAESGLMQDAPIVTTLAASALTMAAVQAGIPLAIGFMFVGIFGALVGHARWTLERERRDPSVADLPFRQHVCMLLRAMLMAEFVCLVLLFVWIEFKWPWTWGLIVGAISSVFASDAIELMWTMVKARAGRMNQ